MTKKKEAIAIVQRPPTQPKEQAYSVELFISQAIEKNLPVETMERLLAMRTQLKQEQAIEAYNDAVSDFQGRCPIIEKKKKVYQKGTTPKQIKDGTAEVRYSYAPLDSIVEQTSALMGECGLSHRIEVLNEDKFISVTCYLIHKLGHKEGSTFRVPIDFGAYMTEQQKYAAALTYAKRYAFCAVTGILTGDEDNDANSLALEETVKPVSAPKPVTPPAPTPAPVAAKPVPPPVPPPAAPINADDAKKQRITKLMRDNGLQPAVSTKEAWEDAVHKNMGLDLKPENYDKIISILESTMGGPPEPPVTPPPAPPTTPTAPVAGPASTAQTATPNAPLGAGGNGGMGHASTGTNTGNPGGNGQQGNPVPVSQAEQLQKVFGDGVTPPPVADPKNYRARAMGCPDLATAKQIIDDMVKANETVSNIGMISGILKGKGFDV